VIEHVTGQRLIRMELKYCEGCGGLLLRPSGKQVIYCASCHGKLAELPLKNANQDVTAPVSGKVTAKQSVCSASVDCDPPDCSHLHPRPAVRSNHTDQRRLA
jgi:LSD1 subclass zinc finger protein